MLKISFAGCFGLSFVKSLKPVIFAFNVVQGHRCWYRRKARQQCVLW